MRSIELNPARAAMVALPGDYPWSSYLYNAHGELGLNSNWITLHEEYLRLGKDDSGRRVSYRQMFSAAISNNDLKVIRECAHKGWALGGDRFREEIETLAKRRATSKGVGRAKKSEI